MVNDLKGLISDMSKNIGDDSLALLCRLYSYEIGLEAFARAGEFPESIEKDKDTIEGLFDKQDENGDVEGISVPAFIAVMCVASRVFEDLDPIFSRECMHTALESGLGLLDMDDERKEAEAMLIAFSELLKTDYEIRNTYDHSLMAGMPQKMSRQKKYKINLSKYFDCVFNGGDFAGAISPELALVMISVFSDDEENISAEVREKLENILYYICDKMVSGSLDESDSYDVIESILLNLAISSLEKKLETQNADDDGSSQLIKVIEYNIMQNKKKKLSDEEIKQIQEQIKKYTSKLC